MWLETERGSVVNLDNAFFLDVRRNESGKWALLVMADKLYVVADGLAEKQAEAGKTFLQDELKREKREVRFRDLRIAMKGANP